MIAALLVLLALAESPAGPLKKSFENGPVRGTIEVLPVPARLSDLPKLTLRIDADEAVDVTLPSAAGELGGFAVRTLREPKPELRDGRRSIVLELELEPLESGKLTFPSLAIACLDRRPATLAEHPDGLAFTIDTDPLEIVVTSLVGADAPSLDALKPPLPPLRVEARSETPWPWVLGVAALVVVAVLVAWFSRKRRTVAEEVGPPPTPEELARREFALLVEADPLGRGELSEFYSELTLIVRRYIERTTGVAAPEQTTEEFLREMRGHASFDASSREKLKGFLESADLVKFAGVRPLRADVEESFRRGQEFAGQTAPILLPSANEARR